MSKVLMIGNDEEIKSEIVRLLINDSRFREKIAAILFSEIKDSLMRIRFRGANLEPDSLQTNQANIYNLRVQSISGETMIHNELLLAEGSSIRVATKRHDAPNSLLRVQGDSTKMNINALNVEELFIQGKKLNLYDDIKTKIVQDVNPSWN